jgi:hypothetical protein
MCTRLQKDCFQLRGSGGLFTHWVLFTYAVLRTAEREDSQILDYYAYIYSVQQKAWVPVIGQLPKRECLGIHS